MCSENEWRGWSGLSNGKIALSVMASWPSTPGRRNAGANHEMDVFQTPKSSSSVWEALMLATRFLILFSMVQMIILGAQSNTRAQPLRSKVEVDCGVFHNNSDGSWTLRHETTVNEGIYGFVLKPGTFRRNDANVFGYDLTRVLEQDCLNGRQKQ